MAIDTSTLLSRRTLIAGTLGAIGASLASLIAQPLRAMATADKVTYLNDENDDTVLEVVSSLSGPGTGGGIAILGRSASGHAVRGQSGSGVGVSGESDFSTGVAGFSTMGRGMQGYSSSGDGVFGESDDGRGGVFRAGRAQLRLLPSSSAQHPPSGLRGDLFVDGRTRLWFCRGGSDWVRLA
jgi:hypothetical protein